MERITPRYVFEARIRISVQRDSESRVLEGWARDISETGLCAFVARELVAGELVTLDIPVSASRSLSIPAKVARSVGTLYGFQFTALGAEQRADLLSAVKDRREIEAYGQSNAKLREKPGAKGSPFDSEK